MQKEAQVDYHHLTLPAFLARANTALRVAVSQNTIDQAEHRLDTGSAKKARDLLRHRDHHASIAAMEATQLHESESELAAILNQLRSDKHQLAASKEAAERTETEVAIANDLEDAQLIEEAEFRQSKLRIEIADRRDRVQLSEERVARAEANIVKLRRAVELATMRLRHIDNQLAASPEVIAVLDNTPISGDTE